MIKYSFFFFMLINLAISAQEKIIAEINGELITDIELKERYEFSPALNKSEKSKEKILRDLLYTLIAERLLADDAVSNNLDRKIAFQSASESVGKLYVRDKLYHQKIFDKININDKELARGATLSKKKYSARFLFSPDSVTIFNLFQLLNDGVLFEEILAERPENEEQKEKIEIYYGDLIKHVEEQFIKLKPGEYTKPLLTGDGWYIFKLYSVEKRDLTRFGNEEQSALKIAEKVIKKRQEQILYDKFRREFFPGNKADTDPGMFNSLASKFINLLRDRDTSKGGLYSFTAGDLLNIENSFGPDSLEQTFITINSNEKSLRDFLREYMLRGINFEEKSNTHILGRLNMEIQHYIESELLAAEGFRLGLDMDPEVRYYKKMWDSHYLAEAAKAEYFESSPDSLRNVDSFNRHIASLAEKAEIKIHPEIFKNIDVTRINSVVFRYMGFGGKISAVPLTSPIFEWVKFLRDKGKIVY